MSSSSSSSSLEELNKAAAKVAREVRHGEGRRFEVYAFPASICSEKVRCALLLRGEGFVERRMDYFRATQHEPAYARLRRLGWEGEGLVKPSEYDGSTTAGHGVDPLVVPTLVDLEARVVVVDSARIVSYLDTGYLRTREPLVAKHVKIVDAFPHAGLLYAAGIGPWYLRAKMRPERVGKIQMRRLEKRLAEAPDDLRDLYALKLEKTRRAWKGTDGALDAARAALSILDADLDDFAKDGPPTAADVVWFVTLLRLKIFGILDDLATPRIRTYFERLLLECPELRDGCLRPGNIPSPHINGLLFKHLGLRFAVANTFELAMATVDAALALLAERTKPLFIPAAAAAAAALFGAGLAAAAAATYKYS